MRAENRHYSLSDALATFITRPQASLKSAQKRKDKAEFYARQTGLFHALFCITNAYFVVLFCSNFSQNEQFDIFIIERLISRLAKFSINNDNFVQLRYLLKGRSYVACSTLFAFSKAIFQMAITCLLFYFICL